MNLLPTMPEDEVLRVELDCSAASTASSTRRSSRSRPRGRATSSTIRRKKKEKLALKDRIRVLEDRLLPDIIA